MRTDRDIHSPRLHEGFDVLRRNKFSTARNTHAARVEGGHFSQGNYSVSASRPIVANIGLNLNSFFTETKCDRCKTSLSGSYANTRPTTQYSYYCRGRVLSITSCVLRRSGSTTSWGGVLRIPIREIGSARQQEQVEMSARQSCMYPPEVAQNRGGGGDVDGRRLPVAVALTPVHEHHRVLLGVHRLLSEQFFTGRLQKPVSITGIRGYIQPPSQDRAEWSMKICLATMAKTRRNGTGDAWVGVIDGLTT